MIPYMRKKYILENLDNKEITYFEQIYKWFDNISESTIRRDLKFLEKEGNIELLRGGGVKLIKNKSEQVEDMPNEIKKNINTEKKEKIAKYAASLIEDGDVIYLDSGTTCLFMLKFIDIKKKLTIVTSNIDIINSGRKRLENIKIIVAGGELDNIIGSLNGTIAEDNMSKLYFDKSFVGGTSINAISGVSTPDLNEARKKQIAKANARESYCLIDSSKFGNFSMCSVFSLDNCNIITDCYNSLLEKCNSYVIVE